MVVLVFILGMGLVGLTVSGNTDEFPSIIIFLAMAISFLSALTILSIRHNAGLNRFIVGGDDDYSSSFANIVNGQRELITCFTPDGEFLFANDAYCQFVDKPRADIIGTSIFGDVPLNESQSLKDTIANKIQSRQAWNFKNNLEGANGVIRTFEWSNSAHFNENGEVVEIQSVGRDVTDRTAAEIDLDARELSFRQLTDMASDWIWEMDADLRFSYFSPNISKFMGGADAKKFLGFTRREMFANSHFVSDEWQEHLEVLDAHKPFRNFVYAFDDMQGQSTWRSISGDPLFDEAGEFCGYHGVGRDITDRVVAENEVKKQRDELERLNNQKDKFFSIIAHDLKNPVNVILGYSQLFSAAGDKMSREDILEKVGHIKESADHLLKLMDDLLAWGQTQMAAVQVQNQPIILSEIVEKSTQSLRQTADAKSISLSLNVPDISFETDPGLLDTIVRNLVANAIKFSYSGQTVSVAAYEENNLVTLSVSDTGTGMSGETQDNLFQLDKAKSLPGTANETGTGLGLFLSQEFANRLGGKIEVSSKENEGSVFSIVLPLKEENEEGVGE